MTLNTNDVPALAGDQDAKTYFQQFDRIERGRRAVAKWLSDQYGYHLLTAYIQTRIKFEWDCFLAYKCSQGTPLIIFNEQNEEITLIHFSAEQWIPAEDVNRIHALDAAEQAGQTTEQDSLVEWPPEINGLKTALIEIYLNDQKQDQAENEGGWGEMVGGREALRRNYVKQYYLSVLQMNGVTEYKTAMEWLRDNQPSHITLAGLLGDHLHETLDQMMEEFLDQHPADQTGQKLLAKGFRGKATPEDWAEVSQSLDQVLTDLPGHLCPTREEMVGRWTENVMKDLTGQEQPTIWLWDIQDRVR